MKATEEELINYYYYGWELNESNSKFPDWFQYAEEKLACLCGFNDNELGITRNREEILKEIKERVK